MKQIEFKQTFFSTKHISCNLPSQNASCQGIILTQSFNTSEWPQLEKRWHKELKALEKHECPYSPTYSLYFLRVSSFVSYMEDLLSSRYNRKREEFFILQDKSSHSCHQNFSTSCLGKNSKSGYSHTFSADDNGHQVKQKSQGKLPQQGHSSENLTIPHAIQNKRKTLALDVV